LEGFVKWFSNKKGYGFLTSDDGKDYFCHYKSILSDDDYKALEEDQRVEFDIVESPKGEAAINVRLV